MYRLFSVRSRLLSGHLLGRAARSVDPMFSLYNGYLAISVLVLRAGFGF